MVLASVILGILAALGWGISDFIAAFVSKRVGIFWAIAGVHISSVALSSIYLLFVVQAGRITLIHWLTLAGLTLIALAVYIVFYKALQTGPVAIVSPIVSAYAVVVILLATAFVDERLSLLQSIAVAASIGGVVLASINLHGVKSLRSLVGRGALLALMAMLGIGLWQFALGILTRDIGWFMPIYINRVMTILVLIPASAFWGRSTWRLMTPRLAILISVAGIVEMGGLFAFARGTEIGVISIVAGASTVYPILPMIGGLVILKERLSVNQFAGLVIALAGLLLLAFST